ncbi:unnamed protein product [Rhodiola kirilowii]
MDQATGGAFMELHPTNGGAIIDKISRNSHHWGSDRSFPKRKSKTSEVDEVDSREDVRALNKKIDALATSLSALHVKQSHKQPRVCAICTSSSHKEDDCPHTFPQEETQDNEDVNFLQRNQVNYGRDRDHPNFSYKTTEPIKYDANWRQKSNPPPGFTQRNQDHQRQGQGCQMQPYQGQSSQHQQTQVQPPPNPTEDSTMATILATLVTGQTKTAQENNLMFQALNQKIDQLAAQNRMLEMQVAQQASSSSRQQWKLPSKPDVNSTETLNVITLRSGKEYELHQSKPKASQPRVEVEIEEENGENEQGVEKATEPVVEAPKQPTKVLPLYKPPMPFPQRLLKKKNDQHFNKFVEMLRKLNITLPFTEVLTQIPSYAKFLKDIVSHRRDISEHDTVALNLECSAIIQNLLPKKLKDPGSFSIPIMIGDLCIQDALCDLGASISLMPYSLCSKLDMGTLTPTSISLRLADRSSRVPDRRRRHLQI